MVDFKVDFRANFLLLIVLDDINLVNHRNEGIVFIVNFLSVDVRAVFIYLVVVVRNILVRKPVIVIVDNRIFVSVGATNTTNFRYLTKKGDTVDLKTILGGPDKIAELVAENV